LTTVLIQDNFAVTNICNGMKRNWIRGIVGGLSFTTALFVFQACYGTPQDMMPDLHIEGKVTSSTTGLPIKLIKVTGQDLGYSTYTNDEGRFDFYTRWEGPLTLLFEDMDGSVNGSFFNRDTVIIEPDGDVVVNMALEEK